MQNTKKVWLGTSKSFDEKSGRDVFFARFGSISFVQYWDSKVIFFWRVDITEQYNRGYSRTSHSAQVYIFGDVSSGQKLCQAETNAWFMFSLVSGSLFCEGRCCYLYVRSDRGADFSATDGLDLIEMRELRLELDTSRKVGVDTRVGERERCSSDALDASI